MADHSKKKVSLPRDPFDYYPTPGWCVDRLLEAEVLPKNKSVWLEPSAGDGAIIRSVSKFSKIDGDTIVKYDPLWVAYEIQPRFKEPLEALVPPSQVTIDNFLDLGGRLSLGVVPTVVIGNPPYSSALDFVKKAMELKPHYICFLLRISFLGSEERSNFMRVNMPDVYMLPNRPSFRGNGADTSEYAWFCWKLVGNGYSSGTGKVQILGSTPKELRVAKAHAHRRTSSPSPKPQPQALAE